MRCQPWDFFDAEDRDDSRDLWYSLAMIARNAEIKAANQKIEFANSWKTRADVID